MGSREEHTPSTSAAGAVTSAATSAAESAAGPADPTSRSRERAERFGLPVYVRLRPVRGLGWVGRGVAAVVAVGAFTVLGIAAWVTPASGGMGTHVQLGLPACGLVEVFGLPCPSCGYTTSFALFVRLRWVASFWNQPAGFTLALACALTAWAALYSAVTGKALHRMFAPWATPANVFAGILLLLLAWAWKIALVKVMGG